ncbi:hypothetical protein ACFOG5_24170 [Pedobacter fastidiosus]
MILTRCAYFIHTKLTTLSEDYFEHLSAFLQVLGPIVDDLKGKGFI